MNEKIWEFMGVHKTIKTEADKMLTEMIQDVFNSLNEYLNLKNHKFTSIFEMIDYGQSLNDENAYFWDWMKETGIHHIQSISKYPLPDNEEVLDFLDYREMLLQMDIENGIISSLFMSISELFTSVVEYIQVFLEEAAAIDVDLATDQPLSYHVDSINNTLRPNWVVTKDSADIQQSLLI